MPEALTKWKFLGFAHDKELRSGYLTDEIVTAKDLMAQPNLPRFLREGDIIEFPVKVSNQSATRQKGKVKLAFKDARTDEPVDATLGLADQGGERAVRDVLLVGLAAFDLGRLDDVEIALPGVAVARPLRMQGAHPGKCAPQWHAGTNEPATQPVEQQINGGALQPLLHRPDVQVDDLPAQRAVVALRAGQRLAWSVEHLGA